MRRSTVLSAWLYGLVWILGLADPLTGLAVLGQAAGLALAAFLVLELPRQRRYGQVFFLAMAALGGAGLLATAHPLALLLAALRRGAAYAAFFFALATLRDAAEHSPLIRRCGAHLVAQPPGRRYLALTAGGHVFGIILSYGAIDLLAAMVGRANTLEAAGGDPAMRALRARRMGMAAYRGFATMNCWNPLNLMTAVVSTAVPGAPMRLLLPIALLVSVGMMAIGWIDDRRLARPRAGAPPPTAENWSIHLRVIGLVALVMALSEAAVVVLGVGLVPGVTLVVPAVALVWAAVQCAGRARSLKRAARLLARRLGRFMARVPEFRGEANVLGLSGFVGVALGAALPAGSALWLARLPPLAVPLAVPVLLMAAGQIGLNPVATMALLGAVLPDPRALGVAPAVLGFACMLGWGVGISVTAMSASAITTARWLGVSPFMVSAVWNARFTLGCLVLSWVAIAALYLFGPMFLPWAFTSG